MKDYYSILECTPMSSREEIKKQFRRLALQYHPDKNQHDQYATARFHDIMEAYETLTQPARKEAWLQERWLRQVMNDKYAETQPRTPHSILNKVLKLDRHVATQDVFRMDQTGIVEKIMALLSDENIDCLRQFNEKDINRTIVQYMLSAANPIDPARLDRIWPRIEQIAQGDQNLLNEISTYRVRKQKKAREDQWTVPLAILFTVILCALIYLAGR
jgi:curved DNA-binding protein CbpA